VWLLTPNSRQARQWIDENVQTEGSFQPYLPTVVVEHRYISGIIQGLQEAGLKVVNSKITEQGRKFLTEG
jgi:hypothetical protein